MSNRINDVQIMRTGTFTPGGAAKGREVEVTGEMLDEMVANFETLTPVGGFTPVVKLGHTDAQRFIGQADGAPNLGLVESVRRVGDFVLANFVNVPDAVMELIKTRRFNSVSVEIVPSLKHEGRTFENVLTAVALLGAQLPAVKGLADLAATLFNDEVEAPKFEGDVVEIEFAEFTPEERRRLADEGVALPDGSFPIRNRQDLLNAIQAFGRAGNQAAAARHIQARAEALGLTELLPEDGVLAETINAENDPMPVTYSQEQNDALVEAAVQRVTKELEDKFAGERDTIKAEAGKDVERLTAERDDAKKVAKDSKDKLVQFEQSVRSAEAERIVEAAVKAGKVLPKDKDKMVKFALGLPGDTIKFSTEDGSQAEKTMTELFAEFLDTLATKVEFQEKGASDAGADRDGDAYGGNPAAEVDKRARALIGKDSDLSYQDARNRVLAEDPKLATAYTFDI